MNKLLYGIQAGYHPESLSRLKNEFEIVQFENLGMVDERHLDAVGIIAGLDTQLPYSAFPKFRDLRFVATNTTGLNHIPTDLLKKLSIPVVYLEAADDLKAITSTAELALLLTLNCIRSVRFHDDNLQHGVWDRTVLPGFMLSKSRVGIVGLGRLGTLYATYCSAMGCNVSFFDPYVKDEKYHQCSTLEELFESNDIISIHVRLTSETLELIGEPELRAIKAPVILINTSRGEILNENAVLNGLQSGSIRSLGTDVLSGEHESAFPVKSPLFQYYMDNNNVVITPHIGGACTDAWMVSEEIVIDKIINLLEA